MLFLGGAVLYLLVEQVGREKVVGGTHSSCGLFQKGRKDCKAFLA